MKSVALPSLLALLLLSAPGFSQGRNDLLPNGRAFEPLTEGERSPFGQQKLVESPIAAPEDTVSEESRLRRIITTIKVSGVSESPSGKTVLLGAMILREGTMVPQLLRDQQEKLRVTAIDDNRIVMSFVERDPTVEARQISLPFDVTPRVSRFLYGEAVQNLTDPDAPKPQKAQIPVPGVETFLKASEEADLLNVQEGEFQMLGEIVDEQKTEPGQE